MQLNKEADLTNLHRNSFCKGGSLQAINILGDKAMLDVFCPLYQYPHREQRKALLPHGAVGGFASLMSHVHVNSHRTSFTRGF